MKGDVAGLFNERFRIKRFRELVKSTYEKRLNGLQSMLDCECRYQGNLNSYIDEDLVEYDMTSFNLSIGYKFRGNESNSLESLEKRISENFLRFEKSKEYSKLLKNTIKEYEKKLKILRSGDKDTDIIAKLVRGERENGH